MLSFTQIATLQGWEFIEQKLLDKRSDSAHAIHLSRMKRFNIPTRRLTFQDKVPRDTS